MCVEHHLLRLPRIGPHEQHAAVTEPDMSSLHHHRGAAQQDDPVAPVELIGFAWGKAQRDISGRGRLPAFFAPPPGVTPHRIVTAVIAAAAQLFEDPDQRQLFTSRFGRVRRQHPVKLYCPSTQLWPRLHLPLVLEGGLSRPQHLPNRVPRHLQVTGNLLDRLALDEVLAPDPGNRLHDQHPPPPALLRSRQRNRPTYRGSILDADPPALGVNIAGRMTPADHAPVQTKNVVPEDCAMDGDAVATRAMLATAASKNSRRFIVFLRATKFLVVKIVSSVQFVTCG